MVEVFINGSKIDILDTEITYVKQVNDLADITTVNSSYSYSLIAPKTPRNTRTFKFLGLVGDTSDIPYTRNRTVANDNGLQVVSNGVSSVIETSDVYKLNIQDGIVDFFRRIENKTIGNSLDLSELNHTKNDASIIDSFTNPNYRYLISEYNGNTIVDGGINPDYQVPSVNYKYLFDKIMSYAGYTYEGLPDITGDWLTYPNPPTITETDETLSFISAAQDINVIVPRNIQWQRVFNLVWTTATLPNPLTDVIVIDNRKLQILNNGNYRITWDFKANFIYEFVGPGGIPLFVTLPAKVVITRSGVPIASVISEDVGDVIFSSGTNDFIDFELQELTESEMVEAGVPQVWAERISSGRSRVAEVKLYRLDISLFSLGFEYFDFGDAFKDYSMSDFIKEVMIRKSLTPFPDVSSEHIKFKTLTERVSKEGYLDWSRFYVDRISEVYSFGSYAKVNGLTMRHDDVNSNFGDGGLSVINDNLKDNQTLFQSKFYAPDENQVKLPILTSEFFYLIKFWDREVVVEGGNVEVKYKPLKNRFFLLKEQVINKSIKIGLTNVTAFPKAVTTGTLMSDVINEYYTDWGKIFDSLRIHRILLKINAYHLATFQMDKVYYFDQQKSYYLFNKLIYKSGAESEAEFLKIGSVEAEKLPVNKPPIQLGQKTFTIPKNGSVTLTLDDFMNTIPSYIDEEGDLPEQIKIISFGSDLVVMDNNGTQITSDTIVDANSFDLVINDNSIVSEAHSSYFDFKIQSYNNPRFSSVTGRIIVNVTAEVNLPPIADAGDDIVISTNDGFRYNLDFQLQGCDSYDPNGDLIYYEWELVGQPSNVTIEDEDLCNPLISVRINSGPTTIQFQAKLTVEDPYGLTDTDTVNIKITNLDLDPGNI